MTYPIREVAITISYNPEMTDVDTLVSDLLDIYGVEGTFVPNGQSGTETNLLDALAHHFFGDDS